LILQAVYCQLHDLHSVPQPPYVQQKGYTDDAASPCNRCQKFPPERLQKQTTFICLLKAMLRENWSAGQADLQGVRCTDL